MHTYLDIDHRFFACAVVKYSPRFHVSFRFSSVRHINKWNNVLRMNYKNDVTIQNQSPRKRAVRNRVVVLTPHIHVVRHSFSCNFPYPVRGRGALSVF